MSEDKYSITLELNKSEWCELANAVSSKASDIRRKRYGERAEEENFNPDEWAEELERVYDQIAKKLDEQSLPY